jgi:hypothetical protein
VSPDITVTESGEFLASGHAHADAQVFCVNSRNGAINGQWVGQDALYSFKLTGARYEDPMQIWYQVGTELSPTTFFTLPRAPAGGAGSGAGGNGASGSGGTGSSGEGGAGGVGP